MLQRGVQLIADAVLIDYDSNLLFWVDAKLHHIACSDLLGHNQRVIMTSYRHLRHPFAITVFEVLTRVLFSWRRMTRRVPLRACSRRTAEIVALLVRRR